MPVVAGAGSAVTPRLRLRAVTIFSCRRPRVRVSFIPSSIAQPSRSAPSVQLKLPLNQDRSKAGIDFSLSPDNLHLVALVPSGEKRRNSLSFGCRGDRCGGSSGSLKVFSVIYPFGVSR